MLCFRWFGVTSMTTFNNHLKRHKQDICQTGTDEQKKLYCAIFHIEDESELYEVPQTLNDQSDFSELLLNYNLDPDLQQFNQAINKRLPAPVTLNTCGPEVMDLMHRAIMDLTISLGSTPASACKPAVKKLIEV